MSGTTRSGNAAYFDANVWVAYIRNESDLNYTFANNLIDKVYKGKKVVYVSDLVVLETISALRRKISSKIKISTESDSEVEKKICEIVDTYLAMLKKLESEGTVIRKNPSYVSKLYETALHYLIDYFGSIEKHGKYYRYKGLNHWDIQHALIARSLGAETFYTTDSGFEELKKLQTFNSMKFVINTP